MRLGISIPDELHRRLDPLKQYINVSQICREAIEERIRCYEKALASGSDKDIALAMEEAWKEELKMREIVDVNWGRLGSEDVRPWVTAAGLRDWNYLHHRQGIIDKQGRSRWEVPPCPQSKGQRPSRTGGLNYKGGFSNKMNIFMTGSMSVEVLMERLRNESTCQYGWHTPTQRGTLFARSGSAGPAAEEDLGLQ